MLFNQGLDNLDLSMQKTFYYQYQTGLPKLKSTTPHVQHGPPHVVDDHHIKPWHGHAVSPPRRHAASSRVGGAVGTRTSRWRCRRSGGSWARRLRPTSPTPGLVEGSGENPTGTTISASALTVCQVRCRRPLVLLF